MPEPAYVVDTGVLLRWYVPQIGWEHAREVQLAFLAGNVDLCAPESARFELAHVLRTKALLNGHLDRDEYVAAAGLLDDLELSRAVDDRALRRAAALASDRSLRIFDALFVDLAVEVDQPLLTSDAKLARAAGDVVDAVVLRGIAG